MIFSDDFTATCSGRRLGAWTFTPWPEGVAADLVRHRDETLAPASGDATVAEHAVRIARRGAPVLLLVRGGVRHPRHGRLVLPGWHRAEQAVPAAGSR